ncbi:MAG: hypothetical protein R6W66_09235 [Pelovirga sp.]
MKDNPRSSMREAWILCLILGMVMINFPFIHIFAGDDWFFSIPLIVLYFGVGWPLSIAVIWLFVRQLEKENHRHQDDSTDSEAP